MTDGADAPDREAVPDAAPSAGGLLRAGREAAGLSVAAVAQQLKLAPRQIAALEDGDWASLPGRTFVRGFVRNYARLLRIDPDAVLSALPDAAAPSTNEHPSLAPTPRPIGELPAAANTRPGAARWAIPLVLVAIVGAGAFYELTRPPADPSKPVTARGTPAATPAAPSAAATAPPGNATTTLPNPLAAGDEKSPAAAGDATRMPETAEAATGTVSPGNASDTPLVLSFQGTSWVEIRDGTGVMIVQTTGNAGGSQAVGGQAPFEVVLGNATAVTVTWQGKPFDMVPFTRQNVARFTLR